MWKKIVGFSLLAAISLIGSAFSYLYFRKPASQPPRDIKVSMSPERIARGRYIYELGDCDGCHSKLDTSKLYLPLIESGRGKGMDLAGMGLPGKVYAPNITPDPETGLGNWTDGEKIRAIREGVSRDGRALFSMMPYEDFRYLSDEDVEALVAYMNTLTPIRNQLPVTQLDFPVNLLTKGSPRPVTRPVPPPDRNNVRQYGEYLSSIGHCQNCHTPFDNGSFDLSKKFAGGRAFTFAGMKVVTANITPDRDTGIGNWTLDYFLERFYRHRNYGPSGPPPVSRELFTVMPWLHLSHLPKEDLTAIYEYLRTQPPVVNKVNHHPE